MDKEENKDNTSDLENENDHQSSKKAVDYQQVGRHNEEKEKAV